MKPVFDKKKTILSEHDVLRFQTVEAMPDGKVMPLLEQPEIPDMSVGWYISPVSPDESQDQV